MGYTFVQPSYAASWMRSYVECSLSGARNSPLRLLYEHFALQLYHMPWWYYKGIHE